VPRRLTKPKREKPQGGSSPHCGHPGQSKNRYSNHAGVLSIEHPVPKMDSVQLPERDVPQHCCPNANMARLAAPKPPGCRFNCGSERRECRCAPKPFWRIGTLAVLPSFSDALLQGHLASTSSPDPTELFSCAYTWRCNPQKAISRRAAAPIPSNRRMASSMANQAPPLWKDIPFRILVTEARQRVLLPGGNCLIFALLFERRSRSRVTAGSCAKII